MTPQVVVSHRAAGLAPAARLLAHWWSRPEPGGVEAWGGGRAPRAGLFSAFLAAAALGWLMRELADTCWRRNSIWSARMRRLARIRNSARLGT